MPNLKVVSSTTPEFKIEKDVPIPIGVLAKYPFGDLSVGDSFFVPRDLKKSKHYIRSAAYEFGRYNDVRFKTRTVEGGVRIWRVE